MPLVSLIGYRGTGKSTVARLLAERLGCSWIDADVEIEARAGQTIKEIFGIHGEATFRDVEESVVRDLSQQHHLVAALGGGAILRETNRAAIGRGTVIWLTADPQTILARVEADPTSGERRPNLTTAGGLAEIEKLLATRAPLYRECADYVVDTVGKTPAEIAEEIVCLLNTP